MVNISLYLLRLPISECLFAAHSIQRACYVLDFLLKPAWLVLENIELVMAKLIASEVGIIRMPLPVKPSPLKCTTQ